VLRELAPGGDAPALARRLASGGQKRVMLVGHEPDLSTLAAALLGTFERPFDKAMVVALHVSTGPAPGRLRFVLDPKSLCLDRADRAAP